MPSPAPPPDTPEPFGSMDDVQDIIDRLEGLAVRHGAPIFLFIGRPGTDRHICFSTLWGGGVEATAHCALVINGLLVEQLVVAAAGGEPPDNHTTP